MDKRFHKYLENTGTTVGDESAIDCPTCGGQMSMQDVATDGCLEIGFVGQCEHCEAEYEITQVEYSATVWVRPAVEEKEKQ